MSLHWSRPANLFVCAFLVLTAAEHGIGQTSAEASRDSLRALAESLGPQRVFEPRVTGGFLHAAYSRSGSQLFERGDPRLLAQLRIEAEIEEAAEDRPSASSHDARGVLRLIQGKTAAAVDDLAIAVSLEPEQARFWSDLSAGHQVRAAESGKASDWLLGLAAAESAVALDPQLAEAVFNRALALEQWSLVEQAADSWERYLRLDSQTGWAVEARERLNDPEKGHKNGISTSDPLAQAAASGDVGLIEEVCRKFPQETREMVEEQLLTAWAEAVALDRLDEARRLLETIGKFGAALRSSSGERIVADFVEDMAERTSNGLRLTAQGFLDYHTGRSLYYQGRLDQAEPTLRKALRSLQKEDSPFALWAHFFVALCAYQRAEYQAVRTELEALGREGKDYVGLRARVHRTLGLVHLLLGDHGQGLHHNQLALEIYRGMGETENEAQICASLAENLVLLGRRQEAWDFYRQGLLLSRSQGDATLRRALFTLAARAAHAESQDEAALLFQTEATRWASLSNSAQSAAGALAASVWLKIRLGRFSSAAVDLDAARQQIDRITDENIRASYTLDAALLEAEIQLKNDPRQALAAVDKAIQGYDEQSLNVRMAQSYRLRSRIRLELNQPDEAERDLSAALNWIERFREGLAERSSIPFADDSRLYYDEMIELQRSRGEAAAAFETSERARARALLERIRGVPATRLEPTPGSEGLRRLQAALDPETVVVAYRVLQEKLLIWTVDREKVELALVQVRSDQLNLAVSRLQDDSQDEEIFQSAAANLHETLIAPIDVRIKGRRRVLVIPDRSLHKVPFAALWDSRAKSYLIERHQIAVFPGAGLIVETADRAQKAPSAAAAKSVLIVADPDFDRTFNPALQPLPGSRREAHEAARVWGEKAKLLLGEAATPAAFLSAAQGKAVLHIAAHALANAEHPDNSAILLARDGEKNGVLTVDQLSQHDFAGTQLVILSGCQTGSGTVSQSEGSLSLARPFLAGGAAAVVASLWPVEDRSTARLFAAFHRFYQLNPDPAAALRAAQLEMLGGPERWRSPRFWSGFQVVGGLASESPHRSH